MKRFWGILFIVVAVCDIGVSVSQLQVPQYSPWLLGAGIFTLLI